MMNDELIDCGNTHAVSVLLRPYCVRASALNIAHVRLIHHSSFRIHHFYNDDEGFHHRAVAIYNPRIQEFSEIIFEKGQLHVIKDS